MTYRMKLFILIIGLVIVSNGVLAATNYLQCNSMLETEVHRKARSIASTVAALIDPELVKAVQQRTDEVRPEYARLRAQLLGVRDRNRRTDVWIQDIFTLVPAPQDPRIVEYGRTQKTNSSTSITPATCIGEMPSQSRLASRASANWPSAFGIFRQVTAPRLPRYTTAQVRRSR
jgi:hypothetical protein